VQPTSESHLPPAHTLQGFREQLLAIFQRNFEQASLARDASATTRFFKLFPVIGWESEGLEAYAVFVVDLIRVKTPATANSKFSCAHCLLFQLNATSVSSPLYYISSLTALFENIAVVVDQHQPIVEKYYGDGKMQNVVRRLLQECDRVTQILVASWEEERSLSRKVKTTSIVSSIFNF
jgi:conserved oligomeric Golgi complex subunit 4